MNRILKGIIFYDKLYVSRSHSSSSYFRKPNPGLFNLAIKKYKLDISKCFMIGDRKSDIDAASKVKCKSIFINRNSEEKINNFVNVTQLFSSFPQNNKYFIPKIL